jgi:hypothetical protein
VFYGDNSDLNFLLGLFLVVVVLIVLLIGLGLWRFIKYNSARIIERDTRSQIDSGDYYDDHAYDDRYDEHKHR